MDEKDYQDLLNRCTENCTTPYCFLKMFYMKQHPSERTVIQLKCIEIAKWTWSAKVGYDIGWDAAGKRWIDGGYAKSYALAYEEHGNILKIYNETMQLTDEQNLKDE